MKRLQLEGRKFGKLTVVKFSGIKDRVAWFDCVCECGKTKTIRGANLVRGLTNSCGCGLAENARKLFTTHGETVGGKSREFEIWCSMKDRCSNENYHRYFDYGGRGIRVCDRWVNSFPNFLEDMGRRPSDEHSIERLDNDGEYGPSNCVWATTDVQARNHRRSIHIEYLGVKMILTDWAKKLNVHQRTLRRYAIKHSFEAAYLRYSKKSESNFIPYSFGHII